MPILSGWMGSASSLPGMGTPNNLGLYPLSLAFTCRLLDDSGTQDWLEPQMENIYYHKRAAIEEHNVSANKDVLTMGRRRRQLPFKIDGNSVNPSP